MAPHVTRRVPAPMAPMAPSGRALLIGSLLLPMATVAQAVPTGPTEIPDTTSIPAPVPATPWYHRAAPWHTGLPAPGRAANAVFEERTGADNPFNGIDVGSYAAPAFADLDADGDVDAVVGEGYGATNALRFFENTGTASTPAFAQRTGTDNPFDGFALGDFSVPTLVDLDADGDLDAFVGVASGRVQYFENTGTAASAAFVERTGGDNPLALVAVSYHAAPDFVDLDADGDLDVFVGQEDFFFTGAMHFFENTGTAANPAFVERIGPSNPLHDVSIDNYLKPAFVDVDEDGDMDVFIGRGGFRGGFGYPGGDVFFYENVGTPASPSFVERQGSDNPLDHVDLPFYGSIPTFVDIDADGDQDHFIGDAFGAVHFFENVASLDVGFDVIPRNPPIEIDAAGGTVEFRVSLTNTAGQSETFDLGLRILRPDGSFTDLPAPSVTVAAGATLLRDRSLTIPGGFDPGTYTLTMTVNQGGAELARDAFTFDKLAGASVGAHQKISEAEGGVADLHTALDDATTTPAVFTLEQNYPNPFNPTTNITFVLDADGPARLGVYDTLGREVAVLASGHYPAGIHTVPFDAADLPSGLYLYRFEADGFVATRTMMLVK